METLDLSTWRVAFCGAEPVRAETLERFAERFAPCGFRDAAFYPCYGLAEATLLAAGGCGPERPHEIRVRRSALQREAVAELVEQSQNSRRLVGCGKALLGQELVIADPLTRRPCPERTIGEIWVKGPSIASGYWGRADDAETSFSAQLDGHENGAYLRTGDLGFLHAGQLYVTGRRKEVLIVRGRNLYPTDIELSAQSSHEALPPNSGAAFGVENGDQEEQLVLVHEIDRAYRKTDPNEVMRAIRRGVAEDQEVDLLAVVLIRHASLPRTTSGKVRRSLARDLYSAGELKVVAQWQRNGNGRNNEQRTGDASPGVTKRPSRSSSSLPYQVQHLADRIERRILEWLRERGGVSDEDLDPDRPFAEYGVDSMSAVELSCELEEWLHVELSPTTAWQHPTPAAISRYLAATASGVDLDDNQEEPKPGLMPQEGNLDQLLASIETLSECDAARLLSDDNTPDNNDRT